MTVKDLIEIVSEHQPELMKKTAFILKLAHRMAPELEEDLVKEARSVAEYIAGQTKTAGAVGDWAKGVGVSVGTTVATGLALAAATDLYHNAKKGLTKNRNWKRIHDANPWLADKASLEDRRRAFNTLHTHAPDIASDPLAGGAALLNLSTAPEGTHLKLLREAIDAQKARLDSRGKVFSDRPSGWPNAWDSYRDGVARRSAPQHGEEPRDGSQRG